MQYDPMQVRRSGRVLASSYFGRPRDFRPIWKTGIPPLSMIVREEGFVRVLFDSIPCVIYVVGQEGCVRAVNDFQGNGGKSQGQPIITEADSRIIGCPCTLDASMAHGLVDRCETCEVRQVAYMALSENQNRKTTSTMTSSMNGEMKEITWLLSASPFQYQDRRFAVVVLEEKTKSVPKRRRGDTTLGGMVGRNAQMLELFDTIQEVARTHLPVLIQGETGTGKERVAYAIHDSGPRARERFVPVNCGAIPGALLEAELFGHVKGAFTGAIRDKKGRFELAHTGTIFLDEIGEMSPAMQVKLLRVLQDGCFERVGGEGTIRVDARVICATNKDLEGEVAAGRFREDLYYRLCVVPIKLAPLRERRDDIPLLVEHFIGQFTEGSGRTEVFLSPNALDPLMGHGWPGNVRELQNVVRYALIKCSGTEIGARHLPPRLQRTIAPWRTPDRNGRRKLEQGAVSDTLREVNGNKVRAARMLGVSRSTLYRFFEESKGAPHSHAEP